MQRGFKSRCELIAKRYRRDLQVTLEDPLPYKQLADHLGVEIWTLGDVPGLDAATIRQLAVVDSRAWSAVTVVVSSAKVIVFNSSHSERRIPNNVVHELAHIILDHKAARVDISEDGHAWLRTYDDDQEEEANWLSPCLLVPRDGLLSVYRRLGDIDEVAEHFQVSAQLVQMRVNVTGIQRQVSWRQSR